jgi:fermentation-respiration switch protein FrsA (DUF1100 family)
MMKVVFPALSPAQFLIRDKWPTIQSISTIDVPTLFISGRADTLVCDMVCSLSNCNKVPPSMMDELYNAAKHTQRRMAKIQNGDHNDTWLQQGYFDHINNWIEEVLQVDNPRRFHSYDSAVAQSS